MVSNKKYGVVYTPKRLADFVASLIKSEASKDNYNIQTILDPACGEGALLEAMRRNGKNSERYYGIDIDKDTIIGYINQVDERTELFCNDTILPIEAKCKTATYWRKKIPKISVIIANPPWSSEKIYDKQQLKSAGFELVSGQYDNYVLFLELAYKLVDDGGYIGFIIPDSIFDSQNEYLRRFLVQKMQIRVIARLGEKIFEEVNRAVTVIVCRKVAPLEDGITMCFRLNTDQRKKFLMSDIPLDYFYNSGKHPVKQARFLANEHCNFDIDTRMNEEPLVTKIRSGCINWNDIFIFSRGVEISKKGEVAICPSCGRAQGYTRAQLVGRKKECVFCKNDIPLNDSTLQNIIRDKPFENSERIIVGENVQRYTLNGEGYIALNFPGIDYKNRSLYIPPKILVRKTGLGIYACIDYSGALTSQTVYIIKYINDEGAPPLEYYLALLNSRVVYYYYLKKYGENEWKSHPYLTKKILFSLPLKAYIGDDLDKEIVYLAKCLSKHYSYYEDIKLERLVMKRYGITDEECNIIAEEIKNLPDLSAINGMKFKGDSNV